MLNNSMWYVLAIVFSLLSPSLSVCTEPSHDLSHVLDVTSCEGHPASITFNVTGLEHCEKFAYKVDVYHYNTTKVLDPKERFCQYNNTKVCNVTLTIDGAPLYYNNSLLQVLIQSTIDVTLLYCSNNFTLLVQGPPDPALVISTLNCTGVLLTWLPPPSLPGCPILYYTITILELNITNITTSTSIYYLLSDIIISNEIYTVTISATNGASTGNETTYYFNTSLAPQVILTDYHIEVDPTNVDSAIIIFKAQVINVDCTPSYPTHLSVNITCEHYSNYSDYNITVTNNGSIIINEGVHLVCPLDQFNCSAQFIWSNLNLSQNITIIDNFNTSQIQTVDITPITNGIRYQCYFLLHSTLWGCGIIVISSTNKITSSALQNTTTPIASEILPLCPGVYTVAVYQSYNESSFDYNHIISQTTVTIIGINCRSMSSTTSSISLSTHLSLYPSIIGINSKPNNIPIVAIVVPIISIVFVIFVLVIVLVLVVVIWLMVQRRRKRSKNVPSVEMSPLQPTNDSTEPRYIDLPPSPRVVVDNSKMKDQTCPEIITNDVASLHSNDDVFLNDHEIIQETENPSPLQHPDESTESQQPTTITTTTTTSTTTSSTDAIPITTSITTSTTAIPTTTSTTASIEVELAEESEPVNKNLSELVITHNKSQQESDKWPLNARSKETILTEERHEEQRRGSTISEKLQSLESSLSSSFKEIISIGQRRLSSQRSIKGAEEETQELLNKPSTIPSEEPSQQEDFDMHNIPPTDVENETSPFFLVGTSKNEEDLDSDT